MQIIIKVSKNVDKYIEDVQNKKIIKPSKCPICNKENSLHHNGVYYRNLIEENREYRIPVIRLLCKLCLHTISLLPEFCLPHFQYSFKFIIKALKIILSTSIHRVQEKFRALFMFYKKRFIQNMNIYITFLRDHHYIHSYPDDIKEKAIKVFSELTSLPPEVHLSQRLVHHTEKHFMAK